MEKEKEKKDIVTKNIYMGDGKFREFRLPKSQVTERSPLWSSKHEIGQRIAHLMKERRDQIGELKKLVKRLEQNHSSWAALAKHVNMDNENFLLDAIYASDEAIRAFESRNFLSNAGWTKLRDVGELSKEEHDKMFASSSDESEHDYCVLQADGIEKLNHYEWICSKLTELLPSEEKCVGESDSNDIPPEDEKPAEKINGCANVTTFDNLVSINQVASLAPSEKVSCDQVVIDENLKESVINGTEETLQDLKSDISSQQIVNSHVSVDSGANEEKKNEIAEEAKEDEEYSREVATSPMFFVVTEEFHQDVSPPATDESTETKVPLAKESPNNKTDAELNNPTEPENSTDVNIPSVTKDVELNCSHVQKSQNGSTTVKSIPTNSKTPSVVDAPIVTKSAQLNTATEVIPSNAEAPIKAPVLQNGTTTKKAGTKKIEVENLQIDTLKVENNAENGNSTNNSSSSSPTSTKKPLADLSGYSRLRLTSSSSSTDVPLTQPATPKVVHGSIWEQKAAEREEQLMAEKKVKEDQNSKPVPASAVSTKPASNKTPNKQQREQPQNGNVSKVAPQKSGEPNEWITFASKKGGRPKNGNFLKDLEKQEITSSATESTEKSSTGTSFPPLEVSKPSKQEKEALSPGLVNGKETSESKFDEAEAEKRAKRRQRKKEQAKLNAEQKQEEEKRMKEQKRLEHEQRIEAEKKEKEAKKKQEYEQRQRDNEEVRRQIQAMGHNRGKNKSKPFRCDLEAERLERAMKIKERLDAYVKSTTLTYRMVSAKLYADCRMKEISHDKKKLTINDEKITIMERSLQRIVKLEEMSKFMVFVSFQLGDNENKYTIEQLLEFIPRLRKPPAQEDAQYTGINEAYRNFCGTLEGKPHETINKATYFVGEVLAKMENMKNKDESKKKTQGVLESFRTLQEETVHFIDVAAYLRTREQTEFFIVEEDYLLTAADSENCGLQKSSDSDGVEKQDSCSQTEEECYDKGAAPLTVMES